jgi:hypothetical protein
MNTNKFVKITEGNIHTIANHLKKWYSSVEVVSGKNIYPTSVWMNKFIPNAKRKLTEESQIALYPTQFINVEVDTDRFPLHSDKYKIFIRITFHKDAALLIQLNDKIRITPKHIFFKKAKANDVLWGKNPTNIISIETKESNDLLGMALNMKDYHESMAEAYYESLDDDY